MSSFAYVLAGALFLVVVWLVRFNLRSAVARKDARAGYFALAAPLFDAPRLQIQPSGFARLAGRWQGHDFDLQVLPDTLTFRKLPSLWLMVTVTQAQSVQGQMHIMARPGQNDTFSRFAEMPVSVPLPPAFPDFCALRCDNAALLPPQDLVAAQAPLFADPTVKELVIAPKGLRLVILAEEADRGRYLLFRDAEMGLAPLDPARLLTILTSLLTLAQSLNEAPHD